MFRTFMEFFRPNEKTRILDVGVTSDTTHPESNYFECMYPYPRQITCVGTEDGSQLMERHPGLKFQRVQAGQPLPFGNGEFDIVFSNAVLEHTGSRTRQATFLNEICRVGGGFFVTTPNRWFPFEHHTGLPIVHYLPAAAFRGLIRRTRYGYWANEANLNILTAAELRHLLPKTTQATVKTVRLFGVPSNLVAYGKKASSPQRGR